MPNLTPSEAIVKIRERYHDIDRVKVLAASLYEPDADSELAADDLDWPYLRPSIRCVVGGLANVPERRIGYRHTWERLRQWRMANTAGAPGCNRVGPWAICLLERALPLRRPLSG